MAVTTMESITSLIRRLKADSTRCPHLPHLTFQKSEHFEWRHNTQTITYNPSLKHANAYLLHEYGHALLGHCDYSHDVTLLEMERAAWDQAVSMSERYHVAIDFDLIESSLDTYRDWLHARSTCPKCQSTGVQMSKHVYQCLYCQTAWRVNEARNCALRRYTIKHPR